MTNFTHQDVANSERFIGDLEIPAGDPDGLRVEGFTDEAIQDISQLDPREGGVNYGNAAIAGAVIMLAILRSKGLLQREPFQAEAGVSL